MSITANIEWWSPEDWYVSVPFDEWIADRTSEDRNSVRLGELLNAHMERDRTNGKDHFLARKSAESTNTFPYFNWENPFDHEGCVETFKWNDEYYVIVWDSISNWPSAVYVDETTDTYEWYPSDWVIYCERCGDAWFTYDDGSTYTESSHNRFAGNHEREYSPYGYFNRERTLPESWVWCDDERQMFHGCAGTVVYRLEDYGQGDQKIQNGGTLAVEVD